ncbi:hypothetical protein B0H14DRAFT_2677507 [Mycena olivaceomarginata]|nr:hypothetical protein B0H14DRAFT_2677507 [Mycena olivaceomarginata]
MNSSQDDDSESELAEALYSDSLALTVHKFCLQATKGLSDLVQTFPNVSQKQRKAWSNAMPRLTKSTFPTFKIALLGKTGSGKSTLINCLLEQPTAVLPSACTSAITEIEFKDSDDIEGRIIFFSKDQWSEVHKFGIVHSAEDDQESPATKAKEKLFKVSYSTFKTQDLSSVTILARLLNADPVREKLGTSLELPPSSDSSSFRAHLEQFLSSTYLQILTMVGRVEIRGRFPVLSSGIILVDLPGSGDDDETRNNLAAEYIKTADGVILVVDIKRAQDDRDTIGYLRQKFNQFIVDGRSSAEDCTILAVTGTDVPFDEAEIAVGEAEREKLNELNKDMMELRQSIRPPQKHKPKSQRGFNEQRDIEDKIEDKIRAKEREKGVLLAVSRITKVRSSMQELFHRINSGLAPDENGTPELSIFCVGSNHFLASMTGLRTPLVFFEEDETEIPKLKTHICTAGQSRRLKWAARLLKHAEAFSESIHLYFAEDRHPGQLPTESKQKALDVIAALETSNLEEVDALLDGIKEELSKIEEDLGKAVAKAIEAAPKIVAQFGSSSSGIHWGTYRACMRRNGSFLEHDLNRELTKDILPHIQAGWNKAINHRIPLIIRDAIRTIEESTFEAIDNVVEILSGRGTVFDKTISAARRSLAIENILGDLLERSIKSMSNCRPQYKLVTKESGPGCYARMKRANHEFIKQNAPNVFGQINTHINEMLHKAARKIQVDMETELRDMSTLLRLCLIDEVNLSEEDNELKESILKLIIENRPQFASKKMDLDDQQLSLNL